MADVELSTLGGVIKTAYEGQPNTNAFTDDEKSKLFSIEAQATKNATDAALRDRSTHTGVQTASTIIDLPDVLAGKVDTVPGKQLSDMNFTAAEKTKLASLEDAHFKGVHVGLVGLNAAHPTGSAGDYAVVDDGAGTDLTWYQWDATGGEWVARVGESTEVTPAQVKSYYESNPDTNPFTDDEKAALARLSEVDRFSLKRVGTWNAATNTPQLLDGAGNPGDYYIVTTAGTQYFGATNKKFELYDWVFFSSGTWNRLPAGNPPAIQWNDVQTKPDFDALYAKKGRGGISAPIQAAYVWSNAEISVPSATNVKWDINSKTFDYFSMLSDGELAIPSWAKRVRVTGGFFFSDNPTGYRYVGVLLNTSIITGIRSQAVVGSTTTVSVCTPLWPVTPGDKLSINLFQTSGATLDVAVASWINVELFEDI